MNKKRIVLSWVLVIAMLISCAISGLMLPVSANTAATVVKTEDFEGDSYWSGITKWIAKGTVTTDPLDADNKVLKLNSALSSVYNGTKGSSMGLSKGKVYALSIDFYGGTGIALKFNESGVQIYGASTMSVSAASAWKTATYFFVTTSSSVMSNANIFHLTAPAGTCIDNVELVLLGNKGDINNLEGGLLPGGDFEWPNTAAWSKFSSSASPVVDDPTGADNKVMYFPSGYTATSAKLYQQKLALEANTTYELSVDVYGDKIWAYLNSSKGISKGAGWVEMSGGNGTWKTVKHTFTTGASVTNDISVFGFGTSNGSTTGAYIDDVKIRRKYADSIVLDQRTLAMTVGEAPVTLTATSLPEGLPLENEIVWSSSDDMVATVVDGVVTAIGAGTATITATSGSLSASCEVTVTQLIYGTLNVDTTVRGGEISFNGASDVTELAGTVVTVTVQPNEGYIMKPGSLKYVTTDGTEKTILNKSLTAENFGVGDGRTFELQMPEGTAEVTAEFVSADSSSFVAETIGTSLRKTTGLGYDGIRFLTRMNLATTFDPSANALMVTYGGAEYEIVEIGSLMKRYEENVELTMENKVWQSKAYVKNGGMTLVDYTESYIDFTVVMLKGASLSSEEFKERKYTARGYLVLEDANGNRETLLCDTQLSNSVNETLAKSDGEYFSPVLRFAVTSDVHIREASNDLLSRTRLKQFFETAYAYSELQTNYDKLDGLFFIGDNTQSGSEEQQTYFFNYLEENTKEGTISRAVMGNHECYVTTARYNDIPAAEQKFLEFSGYETMDTHLVINGCHFILVSMDRYDKNNGVFFSTEKLAWIEAELDKAVADSADKPIFVFQHEPPQGTMKISSAGDIALTALLAKYPQVIDFSGHNHASVSDPRIIWQDTFTALNTGGLAYLNIPIMGLTSSAKEVGQEGDFQYGETLETGTRNGGMYYIVEVDAKNRTRIWTYNIFSNSVWGEPYLIESYDPATFKYTNARKDQAEKPEFAEDAAVSVLSENYRDFVISFPQATCKDVVQSYRVDVYKGEELVAQEYRSAGAHYGDAAPKTIKVHFTLEPSVEYRFEVYAGSSYSLTSDALVLIATTSAADDPDNDLLFDAEFTADGNAVNAVTGETLKVFGEPTVAYNEMMKRNVASFDGVNDGYAYSGIENWYTLLGESFTFETYAYIGSKPSSQIDIFSNQQSGGFGFAYTAAGKLVCYCKVGTNPYATPSVAVSGKEWVHLVGTYDGSAVKLYLNGTLVAEQAVTGLLAEPDLGAHTLCLGGDSAIYGMSHYYQGTIASARLYARALTEGEIAQAYAAIAQ